MARHHGFDAQPDEQHVDALQRRNRIAHCGRIVAERVGKHVVARALEAAGWNYSMGLAQVNRANLRIYGLTSETVFDPCANLRAGGAILAECYTRATAGGRVPQDAVRAALSCYYSGNFTRGFKRDFGGTSYVQRVAANATSVGASATVVPPIAVVPDGAAPASRGAARPARLRRADDSSTTGADRGRETDHHPAWDALGDF